MQPFEKIKRYTHEVCEQIRWKKAKPMIAAEIENHLCDQRDAYIANGDEETKATEKAICQMGDAVSLGQQLDKTHKPKPQWTMLLLTGGLMIIGVSINLYLNYSISYASICTAPSSLFAAVLAFSILTSCYLLDFSVFGKYPKQCYLFVLTISFFGVLLGTGINGRLTWLMGTFFVPLSSLSIIYPFTFALFVYAMRGSGYGGILFCGIGYLPYAVILAVIPSFTGLMIYTLASLAVLCFAIWKGWFCIRKKYGFLMVLAPAFATLSALIGCLAKSNRFYVFLNPYVNRFNGGYVYALIRDFLSESLLFGKGGIPPGVQITNIPDLGVSYAIVYLVHQFGFIVLIGIFTFILLFTVISFYKVLQEKSMLGALLALSVILTFVLQSAFYLADNLGYGFFSSFPLPLISYGRVALFINSALIGFMLSIFRTGAAVQDAPFHRRKKSTFFFYKNGRLLINFRGRT